MSFPQTSSLAEAVAFLERAARAAKERAAQTGVSVESKEILLNEAADIEQEILAKKEEIEEKQFGYTSFRPTDIIKVVIVGIVGTGAILLKLKQK